MKQCYFCSQNLKNIDYKDVDLLRRFISSRGKVIDPRHTSTCAKHQRMVAASVKRARFLAFLTHAS